METAETAYRGMEPAEVWRHFAALNAIPRPSGKEGAARAYAQRVAEAAGATWRVDGLGNLAIRVPARRGRPRGEPEPASAPGVVVQAHLDMVCEKRPEVVHDFERDPIRPQRVGDAIYASGTTLGADNGIGVALGLALLTTPGLEHGPLELLFTVEEETGLRGALGLDPSLVESRLLLNLDSEDPRELTVGCAGGAGAVLLFPPEWAPAPVEWEAGAEVVVSGLKGGHSGVQIHERLANAIRLLVRTLQALEADGLPHALSTIRGGNAHNAIPRDAAARLALPAHRRPELERIVRETEAALRQEWAADEPGLSLSVQPAPRPARVLSRTAEARLLRLLDALPHGVLAWSDAFPGTVETSSNLAQIETRDDAIEIATSSRSFLATELAKVQSRIQDLAAAAGARVVVRDGYPGWEPNPNSNLLRTAKRVYREQFGRAPEIRVIHAGLECGVLASKLPGLDAISFGPEIRAAHTPEEHVSIPSVQSVWRFLVALLAALQGGPAGEPAGSLSAAPE